MPTIDKFLILLGNDMSPSIIGVAIIIVCAIVAGYLIIQED